MRGVGSLKGLGNICCVKECGQCGGTGCASSGKTYDLGEQDCCTTAILKGGMSCSDTMEAPCIITDGRECMFHPVLSQLLRISR